MMTRTMWLWGMVCFLCWSPLIEGQLETTTDQNDCYQRPCLNGGTCVDMFQSYRCECPRNFNGTNCEEDLARQLGCAVSPCENNATCQPVPNASPGKVPYHCSCLQGFTGVNCETLLNQCEKSPPPCLHGTCSSNINSYTCNCTGTGFKGVNCSEDIDECQMGAPCGTGNCYNIPGSYSCECPPGSDGPLCLDIDECLSSPCQNGATCVQGDNNYTCSCPGGFQGRNCEENIDDCLGIRCQGQYSRCQDAVMSYQCVCLDGYADQSGTCVEIDECLSSPCRNNATCNDNINAYTCQCLPGFTGRDCETDIDDCASDPCLNNATCVDGVNSFTCQCVPGFTSNTCGVNIDDCKVNDCRNGATCNDLVNGYSCTCVEGWTGPSCADNIDDCASNPCQNGAACTDFVAAYNCTCALGFSGFHCETNINDCDPDPCQNAATCVDGVNDYTCRCPPQWMGKNCSQVYNACTFLQPCQNNATCSTTTPQQEYSCACVSGFTGRNCETNIDDCVGHTCQAFEQCYDGINNYTCACPIGYEGADCSVEIDECASNPCQNEGTCHDHIGFYNCSCKQSFSNKHSYATGYTGVNCELDINECRYDPPICQNNGNCKNTIGSYQCFCPGQTPTGELITGSNCELVTSYCLASGGNPCKNGATCRNGDRTYACDCVPGFTDKNCSTNIDECQSNPCQYNGTCVDGINGYNCTCIPGIMGPNCETNIDDCQGSPCGVGQCRDLINDYDCNCTDTGFRGDNCEINIDDCQAGICQHNGSCVDGIKSYTCNCLEAYTGSNCEMDIDECASSPCQYNGTCLQYSNISLYGLGHPGFSHFSYAAAAGYRCQCILGIEGTNCEINVDDCLSGACVNNATCVDGINRYTCVCLPGYTGTHCETEINECAVYQPCQNGAACTDLVADYSCECLEFSPARPTYGGKNCSIELRGCLQGNDCQNGVCIPILKSEFPVPDHDYICRCDPGFTGRLCDISTTFTLSSNNSRVTYSPANQQQSASQSLSFRFRTTLRDAVLAVYTFSSQTFVSVEMVEGKLVVAYHDNVGTVHITVDSQEQVNNAEWHHTFLQLQLNISLTLVSDACGAERCVQQFSYPRSKPSVYSTTVHFGHFDPSLLAQTLTGRPYVGCLEDVQLDGVYLYPGLQQGVYLNTRRGCLRQKQCDPYTCSRHGNCVDLWDHFRCDCNRPYWGLRCEDEYTSATFFKDGAPSMATFSLTSLTSTFASSLDLSLFLQTRQDNSIIMYLTNGDVSASTQTVMTLEMQDGQLGTRLGLCGTEEYFRDPNSPVNDGWLNFVRVKLEGASLMLTVNGSVGVNKTIQTTTSCPLQANTVYFGKAPAISSRRRRRQADPSPPPLTQLDPFNGVLQDIQLQNHTLDFKVRQGAQQTNTIIMSDQSNVTLGAESTVSICNTSVPCENGGTCSDVFFNDFQCDCPDGYLGKNCSQPDFCKDDSCPSGTRCQSLQLGFECISVASFDGQSSLATYRSSLTGGLPSQQISFRVRTRSYYGAIFEAHAQGRNNFIKVRVRDGSLEVNYLLKDSGFSSSLRMHDPPINDGLWYDVEVVIDDTNSMRLRLSRNGTIIKEEPPWQARLLQDTVTNLTMLVTMGTLQVGDVSDRKEQPFNGCLEELRVGGILLPFLYANQMHGNSATQTFRATALTSVVRGCPGTNSCVGSLCMNGAQCKDTWKAYECQCPAGYDGEFCQRMVGQCAAGGCMNGALCLDAISDYTCVCPQGFTGTRCETSFDACANSSCANGSACVVNPNVQRGYLCNCSDQNYTGDFCNVSTVNKSCADNLCQNGATCTEQNASFSCSCPAGYTGSLCESAIDYCVNLPCHNGTCRSDAASQNYTCDCSAGFTGAVCDTNISDCTNTSCLNGGQCVDGINSSSCNCTTGWAGPRCENNINECALNVCQHGRCEDQSPGFFCDCSNTGYSGTNCETEINECDKNFCVANTTANCTDLEGDYTCDCMLGFQGKNCSDVNCGDGQCLSGSTCRAVSADWGSDWVCDCLPFYGGKQCDLVGPCVSNPCNSTNTAACQQDDSVFLMSNSSAGNFTCLCNEGWRGETCSQDVDECQQAGRCRNSATCSNTPGSYQCNCVKGYTGRLCDTDIDECQTLPCVNGGVCTQGIGNYTCNCSGTGYEGYNCSVDIDECAQDPPPCNNGSCHNLSGSFECYCGELYLGDRCEYLNPCSSTVCHNGGSCNYTLDQGEGGNEDYLAVCSCVNGFHGNLCEKSPQTGDDVNLAVIIGPIVGVFLLIIIIGVIIFIIVARDKRATHGAYSPSREETAGARVELGNVLKKPPEERLI